MTEPNCPSTPARIFDYQTDLLKEEMKLVDGCIRQHEELTKRLKSWAITTTRMLFRTVGVLYVGLVLVSALVWWTLRTRWLSAVEPCPCTGQLTAAGEGKRH